MALPHVKVLGVYSPGANASDLQAFVDDVFSRNADEYEDLSPEALASERKAIEQSLADAVLLEALVENPDEKFSMGEFVQPDPGLPSNNWQVAWCEKFLTSDGGGLLGEYHFDEVPSDPRFRVIFYIHYWKHENGLDGPYGSLELPPVQPMPQRLWQLAPYEPMTSS